MQLVVTRRAVLAGFGAAAVAARIRRTAGQSNPRDFALPIGYADRAPGDGFDIRHGYCCENTWYNPGYWHTGEDWYALDGDTADAPILAVGAGEVVFAGSEYPGRVVIVRHAEDLFSMYGHLDDNLTVGPGDRVATGQQLGTVLARTDGNAPSHLHFEIRTFLETAEVNGDAPRYGFACGLNCPPGPGYWPIDAPEHPSDLGWRNPTHVIANRAFSADRLPEDAAVIVASGAPESVTLWSQPGDREDAERIGEGPLQVGDRYRLLAIATGREPSRATSAEGYWLWYQIETPSVGRAWVPAAVPSSNDTGSDGRPSTVRFTFLEATM